MSDPEVAGSYGAVDLSAMMGGAASSPPAPAPGPMPQAAVPPAPGAQVDAPLIVDVTEANFEDEMALSMTVPVVLIVYSGKSLVSQQAVTALEDAAREFAGAFQLGKVDADTDAALAQAFQVQTLPTAMALVAKRPVPLFEGPASLEQIRPLIAELLGVVPQLGVTGRVNVDAELLEKPLPAAHEAPRAAEENEDWERAIGLWKKVLANNPADKEAKLALARAEFEARQMEQTGPENPFAEADQLFSRGDEAAAFALLLAAVENATDADAKEAARVRLVELFGLGADPAAVKAARTRLATMLMV